MSQRLGSIFHNLQSIALFFLLCVTPAVLSVSGAAAQQQADPPAGDPVQKPPLTVDEIVSRLLEKNHEREMALRKLQGRRIYRVQYHGILGTHKAEAVVDYKYAAPNDKQFAVVSQTGSKFIMDHVIKGLLDGEKEAATDDNRQRTALNTVNYDFTLAEADTTREASQYVLNVTPKTNYKFLYRGRIWVDAKDFAVARIEAEPAKTPSVWVKRTEVRHRYERVGEFWLPAENESESWIHLGGRALLTIEYTDYKITETTPLDPADNAPGNSNGPAATLSHVDFH